MSTSTLLRFSTTATLLLLALFIFTHNKADVDLWGNVGFVRHLPSSPEFHRTNTFSFTEPDYAWVNHEWLAEYILHHAHRLFGNPGLLILKASLGFLLLGMLNSSMRKRTKSSAVRFLYLALIVSTIGYGFSTRPHLFSYVLFALLLSILTSEQRPIKLIVLLAAPLGCIWANLHGAFFIGLVLLLIAATCSTLQKLTNRQNSKNEPLLLTLASFAFFAGSLINPYGIRLWAFVFESATLSRPVLSEWAPLNPVVHFSTHVDFLALACITTLAVLVSLPRCSGFKLTILILALIAALLMRRNIPLYAIVSAIVAARHVDDTIGWQLESLFDSFSKRFLCVLLLLAALLSAAFFVRENIEEPLGIQVPRDQFPIEAMAFLKRNNVEANALVFFDWAELCIWHLHPHVRVFLDGRFRSAYTLDTITTYLDFLYMEENPMAALDNYPTDLVFVHVDNPCSRMMRSLPGWAIAYEDHMAIIFAKEEVHQALLRKIAMHTAYLPEPGISNLFP